MLRKFDQMWVSSVCRIQNIKNGSISSALMWKNVFICTVYRMDGATNSEI